MTAEEIYQVIQCQFPDFNKTTVYRILASLRDVGLIQEMHVGKGPCRYVAAVDYHGGPQLVCDTCGTVVEIEDSGLRQQIGKLAESNGFESKSGVNVIMFARCVSCAKLSRSDTSDLVVQTSS